MPILRVERLSGPAEFASLQPMWDELLAHSVAPTLFLSYEWLASWWEAYGAGRTLHVLACFDGPRLAGVAPMYAVKQQVAPGISLNILRIVSDGSFDADNLGWLVHRDYAKPAIHALFAALSELRGRWDILELNTLPAESPELSLIEEALRGRPWRFLAHDTAHMIVPLPQTWDAYLSAIPKQMKTLIQRRTRYLEKNHAVAVRRCVREDELPGALDLLFRMHTGRWQTRDATGAFDFEERKRFYRLVAADFLRRGWLDFVFLDLDGQPVATEFGFRYGDTHSFLQGGFDTAFAARSVGVVVKAYLIQQLIAQGVRYYDFLGGDDEYKLRWGAERRLYRNFRCALARTNGALYLNLLGSAQRTMGWMRGQIPKPALDALRRAYRKIRPLPGAPASAEEKDDPE